MNYRIDENDRLIVSLQIDDLPHRATNIVPKYCVIHYTGGNKLSSSIKHLRRMGFSYQLLIDRDGSVTQGTPLSKRASHSGYSNWHGRDWLNDFGIGISLNNMGYLDRHGAEFFNTDSSGRISSPVFSKDQVVVSSHWNKHNGGKAMGWEKYGSPE